MHHGVLQLVHLNARGICDVKCGQFCKEEYQKQEQRTLKLYEWRIEEKYERRRKPDAKDDTDEK